MLRKYIEKIGEGKDVNNMKKLGDMLAEIIYETKDAHHELYEKYKTELYEMAYGKKISDEMAEKWVYSMKPVGEYWTMEETTNAMHNLGYNHDKIEFFVVANMMKNDYADLVKDDDELALKLAHDWLDDGDAKEHKLYCYWKHIIKRD
jgi:hypothetical protein